MGTSLLFLLFLPSRSFALYDLYLDRDAGRETTCKRGNPVVPSSGNKFLMEEGYTASGLYPLRFGRAYNRRPIRAGPIGVNC